MVQRNCLFFSSTETGGGAENFGGEIGGSPKIVLGYDSGDALEQAIAERISVNAREAGISVAAQAIPAGGARRLCHCRRGDWYAGY